MASVHLGRQLGDAGFARTVAIKRLRRGLVDDPRLITMFVDEARLAGRVQHPNVVTTIDVVHDHGELFLVMEYVHGESLKGLITATGKLVSPPPEISAGIACGALRGLHAAHEAKGEGGAALGIVHRDVSPQNLLVSADGTTRVVDFGVAKAAGRLQYTQTGQLKGKPRYMAPEQLTGKKEHPIDRRTDVFSMAIVLWELLAGRRLFDDVDDLNVLRQVLSMPIPSPSEHNNKVPPALALAVLKGLERPTENRHASARDFARAIEAAMPRGLASQDAIGDWVCSIAGERLAAIEKRILEIEDVAPSDEQKARDMVDAAVAPKSQATAVTARLDPSVTAMTGFSAEGTDTDIDAGRLLGGGGAGSDGIRLDYDGVAPPPDAAAEELDPAAMTPQISEDELVVTHRLTVEPPTNRVPPVASGTVRIEQPAEMSPPPIRPPEATPAGRPPEVTPAGRPPEATPSGHASTSAAGLPPLPPVKSQLDSDSMFDGGASRRRSIMLLFGGVCFFLLLFTLIGTRC